VLPDWLADREPEWRERIGTAALDPFRGYARALATQLPAATRVLDPFHVVWLGLSCVDDVRRRVQQETTGHRGHAGDPLFGSAGSFAAPPTGSPLAGLRPMPDEACGGRLPVSAQAHAGTCGQSADRRHSLRRCMVTVTRSAYVQVRCAVVCAVERAWSTVRRQRRPVEVRLDSIMTAVPSKPACRLSQLTGLRPSPTRHAVVGLVSGGSGRWVETVTGGPVRCMNRS